MTQSILIHTVTDLRSLRAAIKELPDRTVITLPFDLWNRIYNEYYYSSGAHPPIRRDSLNQPVHFYLGSAAIYRNPTA